MNYKERNKARTYDKFISERAAKGKLAFDNAIRIAITKAIDAGVTKADQLEILSDWQERAASWLREERMKAAQQ